VLHFSKIKLLNFDRGSLTLMNNYINLFYFFLITTFNFAFTQDCSKYISPRKVDINKSRLCPELMLYDLQQLKIKLDEIHPSLDYYITKAQFDSSYRVAVQKASRDLTIYEFSKVIADFLSSIKDSHTNYNPQNLLFYGDKRKGSLPFFLKKIAGKYYLETLYNDQSLQGYEILKIEKYTTDQLYQESLKFALGEGNSFQAKDEIATKGMALSLALMSDFKKTDSIRIQYVSNADTLIKKVKATSLKNLYLFNKGFLSKAINYFFDEQNTGVLQVFSFEPRNIKYFKKQVSTFFEEAKTRNCKDVIIDLRDNQGGYLRAQEYLMSYLNYKSQNNKIEYVYKRSEYDHFSSLSFRKKNQFRRNAERVYPNGKISEEYDFYMSENGSISKIIYESPPIDEIDKIYRGKCTLVLNGFSMSASVLFASWFKSADRGEIVGTPCLGSMNGTFGNSAKIRLPNSDFMIYISTLKFNPTHSKEVILESISPDKTINYTIESIKNEIDPVFEFLGIQNKLNQSKNALK
jgi:C-terminal processing protease CtpA/Prc